MSENIITLTPAAQSVVDDSVSRGWTTALAERREGKVDYKSYVEGMKVTHENVADHVKIFREAFKSAHRKATGSEIKAYATKVRNGLNYHLPLKPEVTPTVALRVTLSGEGGGTTVVPADHPLYEDLVALVTGASVTA